MNLLPYIDKLEWYISKHLPNRKGEALFEPSTKQTTAKYMVTEPIPPMKACWFPTVPFLTVPRVINDLWIRISGCFVLFFLIPIILVEVTSAS